MRIPQPYLLAKLEEIRIFCPTLPTAEAPTLIPQVNSPEPSADIYRAAFLITYSVKATEADLWKYDYQNWQKSTILQNYYFTRSYAWPHAALNTRALNQFRRQKCQIFDADNEIGFRSLNWIGY